MNIQHDQERQAQIQAGKSYITRQMNLNELAEPDMPSKNNEAAFDAIKKPESKYPPESNPFSQQWTRRKNLNYFDVENKSLRPENSQTKYNPGTGEFAYQKGLKSFEFASRAYFDPMYDNLNLHNYFSRDSSDLNYWNQREKPEHLKLSSTIRRSYGRNRVDSSDSKKIDENSADFFEPPLTKRGKLGGLEPENPTELFQRKRRQHARNLFVENEHKRIKMPNVNQSIPSQMGRRIMEDNGFQKYVNESAPQFSLIREFGLREEPRASPEDDNVYLGDFVVEEPNRISLNANITDDNLTQPKYRAGLGDKLEEGFFQDSESPARDQSRRRTDFLKLIGKFENYKRQYKKCEEEAYMLRMEMQYIQREMDSILKLIESTEKQFLWPSRQDFSPSCVFGSDRPLFVNIDLNIYLDRKDLELEKTDIFSSKRSAKCGEFCRGPTCDQKAEKKFTNKSGRVPYVLGDVEQYVLVKFNREKKRERVKNFDEAKLAFEHLWVVLKRVLWNQEISQEQLDRLSKRDRKITRAVLLKKKLIAKKSEIQFSASVFNQITRRTGQKRNEENLKCIFKYTQKFLRTQFRRNNVDFRYRKADVNLKQKNLIDLGFYTHYFGRIADEHDWPISKFFHPKVFSGGKANKSLEDHEQRPKTINREYIDNLRKSDAFMRDMTRFLNNEYELGGRTTGIINQYKQISEEKMVQKLHQWYQLIQEHGETAGLDRILKDLGQNDKCKLPWSLKEIGQAVKDTCTQFSIDERVDLHSN